jgi:anti-repressor protein
LEQEKALQEAAPKVIFADSVKASESNIQVRELRKILKQNGFEIGQNRLYRWLLEIGYLCIRGKSYNQPTQRAIEMGSFGVMKLSMPQSDGTVLVTVPIKVIPSLIDKNLAMGLGWSKIPLLICSHF